MTPHDDLPVLPGLKPVLEMLNADPGRIDAVFCKKGLRDSGARLLQDLCRERGIRFAQVPPAVLDRLCRSGPGGQGRGAVAHQGVAARLAAAAFRPLGEVLAAAAHAPLPIVVALDQVQDPGNVGTLSRTLYALGGAGLIVPLHNGAYLGPAARRTAAGALERLPVARVPNLGRALDEAEEAGFSICGADAHPGSRSAFEAVPPFPAVLVLGNEEKGLRPGVVKRCGQMLRIPLARPFDSLNVAQAGAILLGLAAARAASGGLQAL